MADTVPMTRLRDRILKRKGIATLPRTKKPVPIMERPDFFPKTDRMKVLEKKYSLRMEDILFVGSNLDVARVLHFEVDRTTVSKWRKKILGMGIRTG